MVHGVNLCLILLQYGACHLGQWHKYTVPLSLRGRMWETHRDGDRDITAVLMIL